MFDALIKKEDEIRKELQYFVRDLTKSHKNSSMSDNLYLTTEENIKLALKISKDFICSDGKFFAEQLEKVFNNFQESNQKEPVEINIAFDPENIENPEKQGYELQCYIFSLYGFDTVTFPISDYVTLCKILELAELG